MVEQVTSADFEEKVLNASTPVLVDFFAHWCGPCRAMHPIIEQLATEKAGEIAVYQLDIDSNPDIVRRFGITSVPTFIAFDGGKAIKMTVGSQRKERLLALFE